MTVFMDSASTDEIKALLPGGLVDGVTTNLSRAEPPAYSGQVDFLAAWNRTRQTVPPEAANAPRRRA